MNIKTKLILATTAVALLSAPASARFDGDEGVASAYPRFGTEDVHDGRRLGLRVGHHRSAPQRRSAPASRAQFAASAVTSGKGRADLAAGLGPPSFLAGALDPSSARVPA